MHIIKEANMVSFCYDQYMKLENIVFPDKDMALALSKELYPQATDFTLVDHGYDNMVVLIDTDYAIRFPRNANAYLHSKYENQILQALMKVSIVSIPHIVAMNDNPAYSITTYLHGRHLRSYDVAALTIEAQDDYARKVAEFAYSMHTSFSVTKAEAVRKELKLDELQEEPWDIYFENMLHKYHLPNPVQDKLAKEYYSKWKNIITTTSDVVIHDDLHTMNMMFDEHNRLTGVLDFGDTTIGTPEQELRQMYRINEHVLEVALSRYDELSGQHLNFDAAKNWAIVQELAAYAQHLKDGTIEHPAFQRASGNLNKWLPDGAWGGGFAESTR